VVIGFRLNDQDIPGKRRTRVQGAIGFGVDQGAAVIHQVGLVQITLGLEPLMIAVQRRHAQRQPAHRAQ
jgi:hypothetical protein